MRRGRAPKNNQYGRLNDMKDEQHTKRVTIGLKFSARRHNVWRRRSQTDVENGERGRRKETGCFIEAPGDVPRSALRVQHRTLVYGVLT